MTKFGVDMVAPPNAQQARRMVDLGWRICCVYIGGPRAAAHDLWHQVDGSRWPVRDVNWIFDGFVPITVGRNTPWDDLASIAGNAELDAQVAASDMGACGFDSSAPMVEDLEFGTYETFPDATRQYFIAKNALTHSMNPDRKIILYSDQQACAALGDLFDSVADLPGCMMASWSQRAMNKTDWQAPDGDFDPSLPPPSAAWQFGGGTIAGVGVDFDSFCDDFPVARYAA